MQPTQEIQQRVQALYDSGQYIDAYEVAQEGEIPLIEWSGTEAQLLSGRLCAHLGARRLAHKRHIQAWYKDKTNPSARSYYARSRHERRGPLSAWRWMMETANPLTENGHTAEWLATAASLLGEMRDFERAHRLLNQAEALAPDDIWVQIERSDVLEEEDRYDEAMATVEAVLVKHPWNRAALQVKIHLLILCNEEDEAMALLLAGEERLQSAALPVQRALLHHQRSQWAELGQALDVVERLSPLAEDRLKDWIRDFRAAVAYHTGDRATAIALGDQGDGFLKRVTENLKASEGKEEKRVLLPVGFVRQHHVTCAPATLTAISQYWERPANHLEVVEEICYDGTPGHSERHWAETQGYVTREFTLTYPVARALLDRGVPFTLATVGPDMGHLQAVVGYDTARRTLFFRDPYHPTLGEGLAEELIESHASTGPRAHVFVPAEKAELIEGLELPDAALWDRHHRLIRALEEHRREDALAEGAALEIEAPNHRLTLSARRALASYDGDLRGILTAVEKLLEKYPNDVHLQMARLSCLRDLSRHDERLKEMERLAALDDETASFGAILYRRTYARELLEDARQHPKALGILNRVLRLHPQDADALHAEGWIYWNRRRMPEALERLRFAACLEDKSEFYANAYANVLRAQGQLSEAVQFLTVREEILGSRSSQPARTLFLTLRDAGRLTEAFAVLEKALARRTDDHDLMLFATLEYARVGRFKEAEVLLERARGQVAENAYLHYAGALASYQGERKNEAQFAEMLIARDPLNIGAHHSYARSLMASDGIQAVDAHFEQAVARFPHHLGLRQAHIEWLRDEGDLKRIAEVIDAYVTLRPTDAWGRRERALLLRRRGQHTTALTESEEACRLEPYNGICHAIRGQLLRDLGKYVEAQKAYGLAIQLDVDQTYALSGLLACTQDRNEKRKMLRWVEQQLSTQPFVGEAFVTFAALADGPYTSEERQASLQRLLQARPDVWQTWSALIDHLRERGQFDEALKGALSAVERFPLTANLRLDLAEVQQARGEDEAAIATLRETLTLHPSWGSAVHRLCYLLERLNRVDEARQVLEQARERTPLDNSLTVAHAELLYRHGERETALSLLKHAVESDPNSDDLWEQFKAWASALGKNETVLATMRGLLAAQPENAHLHVAAARALPGSGLEERLKLIDKALELAPRWVAAHDFKAQILAEAGQFDAAVAACRPSVLTPQPLSLRARAAWIEGVREAFDKAIPQMKAVVNEDASYLWAWQILAGWHYDREEAQPLGEAARQLTRLNPESPQGWGYLAQARLWQNDRAGAKAALNEALRYAPGVSYIGNMLLSLQIEDDELPAAEETLTRLTPALLRTAGIQRMALQLAVKQGNQTKALTHFDSLCEDAIRADEHYQVSRAIHDLTHATWREQALERLHTLLRAPGIPSTLGSQWARGMWICAKGDLALSMLPRLAGGTPAERHAAAQSIANCAEDGETERPRNFLRQYAPMLRQPDSAWGTVAHALTVLSDWTGVVEWTADWQQRTEVEPWMLLNRAEGFWFLGHNDDARAINRHAFNLPADYTHAWHALYLAFDASLRGEDPGPWIADYELDPERLPPNLVYMLLLVHAYARARKQKDFSAAKQLVAQAKTVWTDAPRFPGSKRWAGQIANRIAEAIGGAPAWLWAKTAG